MVPHRLDKFLMYHWSENNINQQLLFTKINRRFFKFSLKYELFKANEFALSIIYHGGYYFPEIFEYSCYMLYSQIKIHADSSAIQQINYFGNLNRASQSYLHQKKLNKLSPNCQRVPYNYHEITKKMYFRFNQAYKNVRKKM